MHTKLFVLMNLPLAWSYAIAAIFLKRSLSSGCSAWQVNFYTNIFIAGVAQLFWFFAKPALLIGHWDLSILAGLTFLAGQTFSFLALARGDVSVATPLLGTKVVAIALISTLLFHQSLPSSWWGAAILSFLGIIFVTGSQPSACNKRNVVATVVYSLISAVSFAFTDVLTIQSSKRGDTFGVVASMLMVVGIVSLVAYPMIFGKNIWMPPSAKAGNWLFIGSIVVAVQAAGFAACMGLSRDATASNILFSSRCIWSVVLAWLMARYMVSEEAKLKKSIMLFRIFGAALLFVSILIVLVK